MTILHKLLVPVCIQCLSNVPLEWDGNKTDIDCWFETIIKVFSISNAVSNDLASEDVPLFKD